MNNTKKKPNLLSTWHGLGGENLTPFDESIELDGSIEIDGAKAAWLDDMFRAVGGIYASNSLSGFSKNGNTLQAEIAMAYFSLVHVNDSTLADKFIMGERLTANLHPEYVERTNCYNKA